MREKHKNKVYLTCRSLKKSHRVIGEFFLPESLYTSFAQLWERGLT